MSVGYKVKKLRENKDWSQPELAQKIGISTAALSNIENNKTKKIDFLLMDKICKEFEVDFNYFLEPLRVNKVEKAKNCNIGCENGIINNYPENILEQIQLMIDDNKSKDLIIKELKNKLNI